MFKSVLLAILAVDICFASSSHSHHKKAARKLKLKPAAGSFGLSPSNLKKGNLAIGFIPAWGEPIRPSNMSAINAILPKPMSAVGTYTYVDPVNNPNYANIDPHVNEILQQQALYGGAMPIFQLAVMPTSGFASVTQTQANAIAQKMASINAKGITVWLRYAHEMNGDWYAYGQQPKAFLASWKMVTNAVRAATSNTYMLWSPNSLYASSASNPVGGWTPYWPGSSYVDLVGMSFYSYGGYTRQNIAATSSFLPSMLAKFDKLYGSGGAKKPMVLSETSAPYTTNLDGGVNSGGDSEIKIKSTWMSALLSSSIAKKYPLLKAIFWFEIDKNENASGNSPVRNEDFRCLQGSSNVRQAMLKLFGSGS